MEKNVKNMDQKLDFMMKNGFKIVLNGDPGEFSSSVEASSVPVVSESAPVVASTSDVPRFRQSWSLKSVNEVWLEYTTGIDGCPAVKDLEHSYGTSWRKAEADRRFFSRRKVYYDAFSVNCSERNVPSSEVVETLDKELRRLKVSLDAFMKEIKRLGPVTIFDRAQQQACASSTIYTF